MILIIQMKKPRHSMESCKAMLLGLQSPGGIPLYSSPKTSPLPWTLLTPALILPSLALPPRLETHLDYTDPSPETTD